MPNRLDGSNRKEINKGEGVVKISSGKVQYAIYFGRQNEPFHLNGCEIYGKVVIHRKGENSKESLIGLNVHSVCTGGQKRPLAKELLEIAIGDERDE